MLQNKKWQKTFLLLTALSLFWPRKSYAYLDPGTGSYFIQILLAGLFTVSVALKMFWQKIIAFLSGLFPKRTKNEKNSGK